MNGPTLFDLPPAPARTTKVREHERVIRPRARRTDPGSSYSAARLAAAGDVSLVDAIRHVVALSPRPLTQFQIAAEVGRVFPARWQPDSIRTACARARLKLVDRIEIDRRWYSRYQLGGDA